MIPLRARRHLLSLTRFRTLISFTRRGMRHKIDRDAVIALCKEVFGRVPLIVDYPRVELSPTSIRIGSELLPRIYADSSYESSAKGDECGQQQALDEQLRQPPRSLSRPMSHIMDVRKTELALPPRRPRPRRERPRLCVGLLLPRLQGSTRSLCRKRPTRRISWDVLSKPTLTSSTRACLPSL